MKKRPPFRGRFDLGFANQEGDLDLAGGLEAARFSGRPSRGATVSPRMVGVSQMRGTGGFRAGSGRRAACCRMVSGVASRRGWWMRRPGSGPWFLTCPAGRVTFLLRRFG